MTDFDLGLALEQQEKKVPLSFLNQEPLEQVAPEASKKLPPEKKAEDPPPLDIFGDSTIAGTPELPTDSLPEVIYNYSQDVAERLGVDPAMVAIPCLAVAAASISNDFKIQPKRHDTEWRETATIWGHVIAEPGEKKTPALDTAVKPLKNIEAKLYDEDQKRHQEYEIKLQEYEAQKKKNPSLIKPEPPPQRRKVVSDTTVEALSEVLKDNPDGVLVIRDELSGLFGSFDAYRQNKSISKDKADYLELYNGGSRMIDRVKRGRIFVKNWSASILGGSQPGPLRRLVGKITDDGLMQRFITVHGRRTGDGVDRVPHYELITVYHKTIATLTNMKPQPGREVVQFTPEAQEQRAIVSAVAQNVMLLPDTDPALKCHLAKWDGLFARLTLIYHLIETAAHGEEVPAQYVPAETAARVAKLMIDLLLPHAAKLFGETLSGDHLSRERWIAGHILSKKLAKITSRDIYRAYRTLRNDPEGINRVMTALTVAGWVKPDKWGKDNRPTRWTVDPRVHELFADRAEAERRRREEERRKIYKATKLLGLTKTEANNE